MKVLILTKSAKHHNYCVAGINLETKKWVRLVSADEETMYALSRNMILYENHHECAVLDIVNVPIIESRPLTIQKENVLIDETRYWEFVRKADISELFQYVDNARSIFRGSNECLREHEVDSLNGSLGLYMVERPTLAHVETGYGQKKTRISFRYQGYTHANWSMTDYQYFNAPQGRLAEKALIVVSIPEDDYNGKYFKFVAQIFPLRG